MTCGQTILILSLLLFPAAGEQGKSNWGAGEARKTVDIRGLRMPDALRQVAVIFEVVVSMQATETTPFNKLVTLTLPNASLPEVMDALVGADPRYRWQLDKNGTIRVSSVVRAPNLADIVVRRLEFDGLYRREISELLDKRPEIRAWFRKNRCSRTEYFIGNAWVDDKMKLSLSKRDRRLEESLDEIARLSRTYFWSITKLSGAGCQITIKM